MPLFEVPGWGVQAEPVGSKAQTPSKKRKRPQSDAPSQTSELNLDKLVKRLSGTSQKSKKLKQSPKRKHEEDVDEHGARKLQISHPMPLKGSTKDKTRPKKKAKTEHLLPQAELPESQPETLKPMPSPSLQKPTLTTLQGKMKQSLDGARFRIINENLYKTDSSQAHQMMRDDPQVFHDYHTGFRHQVDSWPTNPVDHYISTLSSYPKKTVIVDLGCGDATLARSLVPKGMTILSYDLVSDGAYVVEADICSAIPLPGSAGLEDSKTNGEGHIVDVVVCALSLMGTNWPGCLREAWRILKPNGELKIAEVASRLTSQSGFEAVVKSIGFKLSSKDDSNTHFTLFDFKKVPEKPKSSAEWDKIMSKASVLKPCEYKRSAFMEYGRDSLNNCTTVRFPTWNYRAQVVEWRRDGEQNKEGRSSFPEHIV